MAVLLERKIFCIFSNKLYVSLVWSYVTHYCLTFYIKYYLIYFELFGSYGPTFFSRVPILVFVLIILSWGVFFILLFYFWTWATVIIYLPISDSENPSQPLCLCWCLSLCFYCHDKTPWPRAACGGGIFGSLILGHSPLKEVEGSRNSYMHLEARIDVEAMKKWCLQACSIWFLLAPMSSRPGATLSTVNWPSRINHKLRKYITGSSRGSIFSVEDLFPTIILLVSSSTKLASTTSFYAHWV